MIPILLSLSLMGHPSPDRLTQDPVPIGTTWCMDGVMYAVVGESSLWRDWYEVHCWYLAGYGHDASPGIIIWQESGIRRAIKKAKVAWAYDW